MIAVFCTVSSSGECKRKTSCWSEGSKHFYSASA